MKINSFICKVFNNELVLNNQEPGPNETEEKKSECEAVETGTKKIKSVKYFDQFLF